MRSEVKEVLGEEYIDYNLVMATTFGNPIGTGAIRGQLKKLIEEHNLCLLYTSGVPLSGNTVVLSGILIGAVSIRLIIKISVLSWIPSDHICLINLL